MESILVSSVKVVFDEEWRRGRRLDHLAKLSQTFLHEATLGKAQPPLGGLVSKLVDLVAYSQASFQTQLLEKGSHVLSFLRIRWFGEELVHWKACVTGNVKAVVGQRV